jgi:hypothetical protein
MVDTLADLQSTDCHAQTSTIEAMDVVREDFHEQFWTVA